MHSSLCCGLLVKDFLEGSVEMQSDAVLPRLFVKAAAVTRQFAVCTLLLFDRFLASGTDRCCVAFTAECLTLDNSVDLCLLRTTCGVAALQRLPMQGPASTMALWARGL
jgi:hypothetical protein